MKEIPDNVVEAVKQLFQHYIERQQVVVRFMVEYRTDLIKALGVDKILGIDVSRQYEYWCENYFGNPDIFSGVWKDTKEGGEWSFRLHGHGCKMVNIHTGEHFDWDVTYPSAFSPDTLWITWFMKYAPDNPAVKTYQEWITSKNKAEAFQMVLEYMIQNGIVVMRPGLGGGINWFLKEDVPPGKVSGKNS